MRVVSLSVRNEISIGYQRTCCWSKIEAIFQSVIKTKLSMNRSSNDRKSYPTPYPCIKKWVYATGHYRLEWELRKHKVSYENVIKAFIDGQFEYKFRDFLVKKIEVGISNNELVDMINKKLKIDMPSNNIIYATYVETPVASTSMDSVNVKPLQKINSIAHKELGFKLAILDFKRIHTYDKYENIIYKAMDGGNDIIEKIIRCVDTKAWFNLPELKQLDETIYPGAIRTYEKRKSNKWSLVSDIEVR